MADDLYQYFRIEAREILERIGAGILELEAGEWQQATPELEVGEPDPELLGRILRDAHTLKGAARVVRQRTIADAAHALEEILGAHRAPGRAFSGAEISRLFELLDGMNADVLALDEVPAAAPIAEGAEGGAEDEIARGHGGGAGRRSVDPRAHDAPRSGSRGVTGAAGEGWDALIVRPDGAEASGARGEVPPTRAPSQPDLVVLPGGADSEPRTRPAGSATRRTDDPAIVGVPEPRAETSELNELLGAVADLATELAAARMGAERLQTLRHTVTLLRQQLPTGGAAGIDAARSRLARSIAEEVSASVLDIDRRIGASLDRAERELRHVGTVAERLRLVRADSIFTALRRAARDVADAQGKQITFSARGGDVRLDPHTLAIAQPALVQIVRNAVAHGIEAPAIRAAADKPSRGEVSIEVTRRGTRVAFTCSDDGAGFDLDAVRTVAERRGLLPADADADGVEFAELIQLLLRGGISTSAAVTEVSGRGIGLDVARDVAAQLGGSVGIQTDRGAGSTIELVVPLSMVAMDGFVVESRGRSVAIPFDAVHSSLRLRPQEILRAATGDRVLAGERIIPFLPLEHVLGDASAGGTVRPWSALVVEGRDGAVAIGVDRLLGKSRLVLHPLPQIAPETPLVAGAVLDPRGSPQLVLDPDGLIERARGAGIRPEPPVADLPILVIDDSLTTRMLERSILESAGYTADVVVSGEDALIQARQTRYGLFLVDVEMPGIDGFAFLEQVRKDPELADTPAILVTSSGSAADRLRGERAGAQAYVVKAEFDQDVLLGHIRELLVPR